MEGLRAYAVLVVMIVHTTGSYARFMKGQNLDLVNILDLQGWSDIGLYVLFRSHYGVDLFFLISGFLITRMIGRARFEYGRFLFWRTVRIYPAFLVSLVLMIGISTWLHQYKLDPWILLGNLFFLNGVPKHGIQAINFVTWSLFYEFAFYIVFPLLFKNLSVNTTTRLVLLFAFIVIAAWLSGEGNPRFGMFIAGAIVAKQSDDALSVIARRVSDHWVALLYLLATLSFSFIHEFAIFTPIYSFAGGWLFIQVVFGKGWLNGLFTLAPIRYLGNISYSFYLVHVPALVLTFHLAGQVAKLAAGGWTYAVLLASEFALSLVFAIGLFAIAERPYFQLRRSHFGRRAERGGSHRS